MHSYFLHTFDALSCFLRRMICWIKQVNKLRHTIGTSSFAMLAIDIYLSWNHFASSSCEGIRSSAYRFS
ncbi:hypothetical protein H5410_011605 [Solanum commersonii]|uniref:Uncharacterized protein n=1 Tax=Solanum commersonii TaxID=4109 RepID=A0A9J6AQ49_SOLCO|nr:hypothetical protein H5410_011605 [Solanum commersonii]